MLEILSKKIRKFICVNLEEKRGVQFVENRQMLNLGNYEVENSEKLEVKGNLGAKK